MDPWFVFFLVLGAASLVGVGGVGYLLGPVIAKHFSGAAGGWSELAQAYGVKAPAPEDGNERQSLVVGRVLYRNCVEVAATEAGLYMKLGFPASILARPAVLIPWRKFTRLDDARLYWRKAALLSIGGPVTATLTLPMDLYEKIRSHLPASLIDAREA
jgi:hypothetical protein